MPQGGGGFSNGLPETQEEEKENAVVASKDQHGGLTSQSSCLSTTSTGSKGQVALSGRNKLSLGFYNLN